MKQQYIITKFSYYPQPAEEMRHIEETINQYHFQSEKNLEGKTLVDEIIVFTSDLTMKLIKADLNQRFPTCL